MSTEQQRLNRTLEERSRQLQTLAIRRSEVEEEERQRIAAIFHNDLRCQARTGDRTRFMGGSLSIESAPGQGSRFTLTVPLSLPDEAQGASVEARQPSAPRNPRVSPRRKDSSSGAGCRVLFVDDHQVMRQAGVEALVSKTGSADSLLKAIRGPAERP
jgi:hypothetical protein